MKIKIKKYKTPTIINGKQLYLVFTYYIKDGSIVSFDEKEEWK